MKIVIVLDASPLGLLFQTTKVAEADRCRAWLKDRVGRGVRFVVPEIVNYELRRELLRLKLDAAVAALDQFNAAVPGRYLPLTTAAIEAAARMWAEARHAGIPTAHPHALDVDVILAAQVLSAGFDPADFVVATSNVGHLARFVPADLWPNIA